MDTFIRSIEATAKLVGAVAWPSAVLIVLWWFKKPLKEFLDNVSEGSVKGFGFEANAKKNATVEIVKADLKKSAAVSEQSSNMNFLTKTENSFRYADAVTHILPVNDLKGRNVLWIDDYPENTLHEQRALSELGINLVLKTDTEGGIEALAGGLFDAVVIVPPHIIPAQRSQELLDKMKQMNIPYVIYRSEEAGSDWQSIPGAYAVVKEASDLVLQVASAIGRLSGSDAMLSYVGFQEALRNSLKNRPAAKYWARSHRRY